MDQEYMTDEKAQAYTTLSRTALWRYRRDGTIRNRKVGTRVIYSKSDLDCLLDTIEQGYGGDAERRASHDTAV